jgi:hypothetical protein
MLPTQKARVSRRHFLLAVGAGGAASAAALVAKSPPAASSSGNSKRVTRGYRASQHIHNYYRTTKI